MKKMYLRDVPHAAQFRHFAKWYTKTGSEYRSGSFVVYAIDNLDYTVVLFNADTEVTVQEKDEFITVSR
jgi:hypothetical protein